MIVSKPEAADHKPKASCRLGLGVLGFGARIQAFGVLDVLGFRVSAALG